MCVWFFFFFSSRRRHTRSLREWSSDVCSSDLNAEAAYDLLAEHVERFIAAWDAPNGQPALVDYLPRGSARSEEHTSELQSRRDLVCRLLLEKKNKSSLLLAACLPHVADCTRPS